jgi:phage gpG-like protein
MRITVKGLEDLEALFRRISPKTNPKWVGRGLVKAALLTQKISTTEMIKRGGRVRGPKGPRGGRGRIFSAAPIQGRLTSRSGRLRGSIAVDRTSLPVAIHVGTDVIYGSVHESGWSGTQHVKKHTRTVAFGRKVDAFSVGPFSRRMSIPARPFLKPALDKAAPSFDSIFIAELRKELA